MRKELVLSATALGCIVSGIIPFIAFGEGVVIAPTREGGQVNESIRGSNNSDSGKNEHTMDFESPNPHDYEVHGQSDRPSGGDRPRIDRN